MQLQQTQVLVLEMDSPGSAPADQTATEGVWTHFRTDSVAAALRAVRLAQPQVAVLRVSAASLPQVLRLIPPLRCQAQPVALVVTAPAEDGSDRIERAVRCAGVAAFIPGNGEGELLWDTIAALLECRSTPCESCLSPVAPAPRGPRRAVR